MKLTFLLFIFNFSCLFAGGFELKDGETFLFLGDSITHKGHYSKYVETYFVTRYPERKITFINSGISGDKAKDALNRFAEDVAAFKPDHVSIMLGMNDGGYKDFSQDIFNVYKKDMATILLKLNEINAKAIVITPTIFDQQQYALRSQDPTFRFNRLKASKHYNATMAFFGAWVREEAMKHKLDFVNFWGPLNDFTVTQRITEPQFTFTQDAIHPEAPGHAIMAASLISDLKVERKAVSSVQANYNDGKWNLKTKNAEATEIKGNSEELSFFLKAGSLPWVLPEEAALGYQLTKSGHKLSNERVSISGLESGKYRISIDGQDLGKTFSDLQLERKIELQENSKTPQYQQAAEVAALIEQKFNDCILPYRNLQAKMKGQRNKHGLGSSKVSEFRQKLQPQLDDLLKKSRDLSDEIYNKAQTKEHHYIIKKIQ